VPALRISDLHGVTREHAWSGPVLRIGSHPASDLTLPGRGVADHHCVLERGPDGALHLRDCGSSAGTFVDSERLDRPRPVAPGARIDIGEHRLELLARPDPAPPRSFAPRLALGGAALALLAAFILWPRPPPLVIPAAPPPHPTATPPAPASTTPSTTPPTPPIRVRHEVIPGELVADIAARYGVSAHRLAEDLGLNIDVPPAPGAVLEFAAVDPPLPKLRLRHTVEAGDTWAGLGERFELGQELLHRYNPGLRGELVPGAEFIVWVDPQIARRRDEPLYRSFPAEPGAASVGAPTHGTLENGIQLPPSRDYERIYPDLQYGSTRTITLLRTAIAAFRQRYRYEGVLVVANLSRQGGGPFKPHASHQSGRDVDIWLPALKGTYQREHLDTDRKPRFAEINWFAAWALVESLLATGEVTYVFLDRTRLPSLYRAAVDMGAPPDLLAKIQWQPDDADPELARRALASAPVRHAADHIGHLHVRFKCGPDEPRCSERPEIEAP
jgi:hypothetical protein